MKLEKLEKIKEVLDDNLICLVRYFRYYNSPNSQVYSIYESNLFTKNENGLIDKNELFKMAYYDDKGCLIFIHPVHKTEHNLIDLAHQLKGIDFYFVISNYKNSIRIELEKKNNFLVKRWFSPSDMANKTSSKILERKIRKAQGKDKELIMFIISSIFLVIVLCCTPFLPILFNILAG